MHPSLQTFLRSLRPSIQNKVTSNYSLQVQYCIRNRMPAMDFASDTTSVLGEAVNRYLSLLSYGAQMEITPILDSIVATCNTLKDSTIAQLVAEGDETAPIFCECLRAALIAEAFERYFSKVPATFPYTQKFLHKCNGSGILI